jgi:hypothetical protein
MSIFGEKKKYEEEVYHSVYMLLVEIRLEERAKLLE